MLKVQEETNRLDHYCDVEEIESLVRQFEACTLPSPRWTHAAHLTVALWYLTRNDREVATTLIRSGIQRYNESRGVKMTKDSGYHETITLFMIWAISEYLDLFGERESMLELANDLIAGPFGSKAFPLEYYSKDRLMSWEARLAWVEPDLKPLEYRLVTHDPKKLQA